MQISLLMVKISQEEYDKLIEMPISAKKNATDFTDGTMKGIYTKDANTGKWNLTTMYPDPP